MRELGRAAVPWKKSTRLFRSFRLEFPFEIIKKKKRDQKSLRFLQFRSPIFFFFFFFFPDLHFLLQFPVGGVRSSTPPWESFCLSVSNGVRQLLRQEPRLQKAESQVRKQGIPLLPLVYSNFSSRSVSFMPRSLIPRPKQIDPLVFCLVFFRCVLIAMLRIPIGLPSPTGSSSVLIAPPCIVALASMSASSGDFFSLDFDFNALLFSARSESIFLESFIYVCLAYYGFSRLR